MTASQYLCRIMQTTYPNQYKTAVYNVLKDKGLLVCHKKATLFFYINNN